MKVAFVGKGGSRLLWLGGDPGFTLTPEAQALGVS